MDRHAKREYAVIALTSAVVQRAEDMLTSHPLRAYDSVQLASALEANNRLITAKLTPLIFVSADTRLLTVAISEGLTTDDPNAHP
jgi:predicted nucleic acid-binding protein